MKYTIKDFRNQFPDEKACLAFLFNVRYGRVVCECGKSRCFYPRTGRKTYSCAWCGHEISPTAGTIYHKSPTPLMLWFHAMYLFATAKNGVAAKELQRQLGVTYKCAWRIAKMIRLLMCGDKETLGGMIEADETYVGGKHHGKRGLGAEGKTPVFGVVERGGKVKTRVIKKARGSTVIPLLSEMAMPGSVLSTDESGIYNKAEDAGYIHERVKHSAGQYIRGSVHTQTIDGFWSQFKRSVNGTYHSVSPKHLQTYLDEFCFRYDHCGDLAPLPVTLFARAGQNFLTA